MGDRPLVTDEAIEQRRLADVGPTHDRHRGAGVDGHVLLRRPTALGRRVFRQAAHHLVEQLTGSPTVQGTHHPRVAETETGEVPGVGLAARGVDLVGHEHDRRPGPAQVGSHRLVLVGHTDRHVHHEQHQVGHPDGPLGLGADLSLEPVGAAQPASCVDESERTTVPLGDELLAITGDARSFLHDRDPLADDAVDERGLADVGPAHHGHHRPGLELGTHRGVGPAHGCSRSRARRRERPSVGTISTGRGRSAGTAPSRKRPCERHTSGRRYRCRSGCVASTRATS